MQQPFLEDIAPSNHFQLLILLFIGIIVCLVSATKGNADQNTKQVAESVAAVGSNFDPLFPGSKSAIKPNFLGIMGLDIDLVRQMAASPETLAMREGRIKKTLGELQRRSDSARTNSTAMSKLVDLIEEQAIALEIHNLESSEEQVVPNLEFDFRTLLRHQSRLTYDLVLNNKNHMDLEKWKSTLLISRMRMGDSSVRDEALAMVNHSNVDIARTIRLLGVATDILAGKSSSSFGSPETLAVSSINPYDKLALTGLFGLAKAREGKNSDAAKTFQSALAMTMQPETFSSLPKANLLIRFFARNLVDAMKHSGQVFEPLVKDILLRARQEKLVVQYLENLALGSLPANPTGAIKYYIDLQQSKLLASDENKKIENRIFEIAIAANDPILLEAAWKRLVRSAALESADFEGQASRSLEFLAFTYRKNPSNENARRLSDINDLLAMKFTSLPNGGEYSLLILQALQETGNHQEVVRRSSTMLKNTTKDWLLEKIFKLNLDSRAVLIGLPVKSCEANESALSNKKIEIDEYLAVLDRYLQIAQKPERSVFLVRSAYALTLRGALQKAIDRFEEGFSDSIDSQFSQSCAAFLVKRISPTGNTF
ncbi:hypothetical protein EBR21_13615, partial [bacterium]|nr:hypothetical protein [bacterium]